MKDLLKLKRIYEVPDEKDGFRVLVDRLWPRGISKEKAKLDCWMKELGPTHELRKWYHHDLEKFHSFKEQYVQYLNETEECQDLLGQIKEKIENNQQVTLLYAAKNEIHNQATVLKEVISNKLKG